MEIGSSILGNFELLAVSNYNSGRKNYGYTNNYTILDMQRSRAIARRDDL
jgi:hypothetical protein